MAGCGYLSALSRKTPDLDLPPPGPCTCLWTLSSGLSVSRQHISSATWGLAQSRGAFMFEQDKSNRTNTGLWGDPDHALSWVLGIEWVPSPPNTCSVDTELMKTLRPGRGPGAGDNRIGL